MFQCGVTRIRKSAHATFARTPPLGTEPPEFQPKQTALGHGELATDNERIEMGHDAHPAASPPRAFTWDIARMAASGTPVLDTGRPKRYARSSATGTAYGKASAPGPETQRLDADGLRRVLASKAETRNDEAIRAVERAIGRGRARG